MILEDIVARVLRDELIGADPLQREWLWHRMWEIDRTEELPAYILGLVDTALWDLAGRLTGQPGWQLLGGYRRVDRRPGLDRHVRQHRRISRCRHAVPRTRLPGDQAARLGRRPRRR